MSSLNCKIKSSPAFHIYLASFLSPSYLNQFDSEQNCFSFESDFQFLFRMSSWYLTAKAFFGKWFVVPLRRVLFHTVTRFLLSKCKQIKKGENWHEKKIFTVNWCLWMVNVSNSLCSLNLKWSALILEWIHRYSRRWCVLKS